MKHLIAIIGLWAMASGINAQEIVSTSGGLNDVFYSMSTGDVSSTSNTDWDLAFEVKGSTGSILINGQMGNQVYASKYTIAEWATFDSAGFATWPAPINSLESWGMGAFNQNPSSAFDLGWGVYNVSTHAVTGDSIFFLSLADGTFKKMYVKDLTSGVYTIVYADIDGSNEMTKTISIANFSNENFAYFSFNTEATASREPNTKTWDIVFTKYIELIPVGGGQFQNYPVSGVKINKGVEVAQRNGIAVSSNDTNALTWSTKLTEIGSDWKMFDGSKYVFAEDQVYFLRLADKSVWKIYFTNYEGGSKGNFYFNKELIAAGSSGLNELNSSDLTVFPNPANGNGRIYVNMTNEKLNSFQVLDSRGAVVPARIIGNVIEFNATPAAGVYFIQILHNQGIATKTLIIR